MKKEDEYPKIGDKPPCYDHVSFRGYRQVYVMKHKAEENSHDSREVFFQCGNWCYDGTISLDFLENTQMSLSDIPKVAPALQRQQEDLSFVCLSSSVTQESQSFAPAINAIDQAHSFLANELNSNHVAGRLEEHKANIDLFDNGHYFELVGDIPNDFDDLECICAKTYTNNGLCFITIYFEGVFYCILSNIDEDEPLLDIEFPDVSQEGEGITLGIYDENQHDEGFIQWRKISLWQSIPASESVTDSSQSPKISLPANKYVQTYCVLKPNRSDQSNRDVLFRFGSWFYAGNVELIESLTIDDIPHVIPALRIQQHKLTYLCDVSNIPRDNLFTESILYNDHIISVLESEILAVEGTIDSMRKNHGCSWLDEDLANIFFEFTCATKNNSILRKNHIDLIATKSYRPNGIVVITIYFEDTFYVCLCNGDGDQPLLDSDFPCVIQGKGYQLRTYPNGLDEFPDLRKLSLWQNAEAVEKNIFRNSPRKQENKTDIMGKTDQYQDLEEGSSSAISKEVVEQSSKESNDMAKLHSETKPKIQHSPNHERRGIDFPKQRDGDRKFPQNKSEEKDFGEGKHCDDSKKEQLDAKSWRSDVTNYPRKKNLGAFHHLAPLKKISNRTSNLQEQINNIKKGERIPYNKNGQPII